MTETTTPNPVTELHKIAERIAKRAEAEKADRARQRVLIRARKAEGASWTQIQVEARVSRPTVRDALHGTR